MCADSTSSLQLEYTTSAGPCQAPVDEEAAAEPAAETPEEEAPPDRGGALADERFAPAALVGFPVSSRIFGSERRFVRAAPREDEGTKAGPTTGLVPTKSLTLMHNQACVVSCASTLLD